MVRTLAINESVCVRPVLRRVTDRATGATTTVAIPCGSTSESRCPSCATKARWLRMTQCAEGWHRDDEPEEPDLEDPADLQEGAQRLEVGDDPDRQRPDDRTHVEGAERPAGALAALHDPDDLERAERLAEGRPADLELRRKLELRGDDVAGSQAGGVEVREDPILEGA